MPSTIHDKPPALLSLVRLTSFFTCLLVALASGTNYVYSAYSPQLGSRLHLSHTQQNVIGLSGNVGVYGTAPLWGRVVDQRGPRGLLIMAFISLLVGYNGIRHFYDSGIPEGKVDLPTTSFIALVACGFLTGIGGNGGLAGAMNATAKSFPDSARATTTGIVISGFGLSAFLFSTIAHLIFPGNTSEFLQVLAIGTSLPMILGFFLIRPIPLPRSAVTNAERGRSQEAFRDELDEVFTGSDPEVNSQTRLLSTSPEREHDEDDAIPPIAESSSRGSVATDYVVPVLDESVALSTRSANRQRSRSAFSRRSARTPDTEKTLDNMPNISGMKLFASKDFWLLFTITSLLSGTGLMYINNVGSISQALFAKGNAAYDEVKAAQWQAAQVSTISVMNCLGRISIGVIADFVKTKLHFPRTYCIGLVSSMFIISQLVLYSIDDVHNLWKASTLLGLAYGGMFSLFPTLVIEWFGLAHFSENWGFVSLSPMIGGNVFSIAFGRNLDARASEGSESTLLDRSILLFRDGAPTSHQCLDGRSCYVDSIKMTLAACSLALILGIYAGWRHRQPKLSLREETEVIWNEDME